MGIQTSTIWIVASFSNTAAGVNPGACSIRRFFKVTTDGSSSNGTSRSMSTITTSTSMTKTSVRCSSKSATIHHGNPDLDHLDRRQFFEHRGRRQSRRVQHQAVLQGDLQTVSQERNQNVCVGPMYQLMTDGPDAQFAFQRAEHTLDLRQLHVSASTTPLDLRR